MPPLFTYSDPRGIEEPAVDVSITSNVRWANSAFSMAAEAGDSATSGIDVDDDAAAYTFVGLRAFTFRETAAPSNNQIVFRGVIQDRQVGRGPSQITGSARKWSLELTDYNWHLTSRILVDSDAKRPRETPGDRIRWLLNSAAHISLNDYGHVTYPTSPTLDANDYRGQRAADLLVDCAVEGGYNFWVDFNEAHQRPELFFLDPDGNSYTASIGISNVLSDVDNDYIYAPYEDATLRRSPKKITYGAFLAYNGGSVYRTNATTGEQFAKIDQTAPMANVKTKDRANRIADKFLSGNNAEEDRITCSIKVPLEDVNSIRHGHLMAVKFSHLPGYESWSAMRVVRRTVISEPEGGDLYYRIQLELVPSAGTASAGPPGTGIARVYEPYARPVHAYDVQELSFGSTGDAPSAGRIYTPKTQSKIAYLSGGSFYTYRGFQVSGTGTVDLYLLATGGGVCSVGAQMSVTILRSGVPIATCALTRTTGSGTWLDTFEITATGVSVSPGDTITATLTGGGHGLIPAIPVGSGSTALRFDVTASSLS